MNWLLVVVCSSSVFSAQSMNTIDALRAMGEEHPIMASTIAFGAVVGIRWLVTKPSRDRAHQTKLKEILETSQDIHEITRAFKSTWQPSLLVGRCVKAAGAGDFATVKLCFEVGIQPTDQYKAYENQSPQTTIWNAMCNERLNIIKLCFDHGVTPITEILGQPALVRAFNLRWRSIIPVFLEQAAGDICWVFEHKKFDWYGARGFLPICMPLFVQYGNASAIAYLLKNKDISLDYKDEESYVAIHRAAMHGNHEILTIILAHDRRQATALGPYNETPLMLAAAAGHEQAIEILWQATDMHSQVDSNRMTPLAHAAAHGQLGAVKKLIALMQKEHGSALEASLSAAMPLHYALYNSHFDIAMHLLEQGAAVEAQDENQSLPLHAAVFKRNCPLELIRLLLNKTNEKNFLNHRNLNGQTSFDIALISNTQEVQELFMQVGARPAITLRKPH